MKLFKQIKHLVLAVFLLLLAPFTYGKFQKHSVGIYISPQGQEYFKNNLKGILENNGFSPDAFSLPSSTISLEEAGLDQIITDQEMNQLAVDIKSAFNRYFNGLELKDIHQFQIEVGKSEFKAQWNEVGIEFFKPQQTEGPGGADVMAYVWIDASHLDLKINNITARDLKHPFIGELGVDGLHIVQIDNRQSLRIGLPLKLRKNEQGKFEVLVENPQSNTDEIRFDMEFTSPLRIPEIKVSINGHEASLNLEEVEKLVRDNEALMLEKIQETLKEQLETRVPGMVQGLLGDVINNAFDERTEMIPPGAPEGQQVPPISSEMRIEEIDFAGDNLHLGLGVKIDDPSARKKHAPIPQHHSSLKPKLSQSREENYDVTIALNEGFINRIIQLTAYRGYFSNMDVGGGEKISLYYPPVFNLKNKKPTLSVVIVYTVKGFQSIFVKNPIQIELDLELDFPMDKRTKDIGIVVSGIDLDSVNVDSKFINMMGGAVRKAAKERVKEMQGSLVGRVLADELPIPSDFGGIVLEKEAVDVNRAGYLMIYNNFGKSN